VILVVDICSDGLSRLELVRPIEEVLNRSGISNRTRHYLHIGRDDIVESEKVVVCGAALEDSNFLDQIDAFGWLKDTLKPVLAVGAGVQAVVRLFGSDLIDVDMIGQFKVDVVEANILCQKSEFYAYFLTSKAPKPGGEFGVLARANGVGCLTKHRSREVYCCLFHPEALNPEIVVSFCKNV